MLPLPTRFEQCFATKRIAFRAAEQYIADLERERGNMSICGRELVRWYEAQRRQVTGPK